MALSIQLEKEVHVILQKLEKAIQKESEKSVETKKISEKTEEHKLTQEHKPAHNSLQHEPSVSVPLLSLLVEALKKDNKDDEEKEGLEIIAEEAVEEDATDEKKRAKKDAIVALADRIKRMYATEMMQEAYAKAMQSNYNPNAHYQNNQMQTTSNMIRPIYEQEDYSNPEKLKLKEMKDENSKYNKLAGGGKYQAFIMTDPKGRLNSTWEIVRVMNESSNGTLERNDGIHYQGLS
ncbi:MAG: hypothetical protein AABX82_07285 [Nanoarchaeota archaeon]